MLNIFGIRPRHISSLELAKRIQSEQSSIIHCIDTPLLVAGHKNSWLKQSLNQGNISVFTNMYTAWCMQRIHGKNRLPQWYAKCTSLPFILRLPIFLALYPLQGLSNLFSLISTILLKKTDSLKKTASFFDIEQLLYKAMRIGSQHSWKVMVAGHNRNSLSVARSFITNLYPNLSLSEWYPHSLILKEEEFDANFAVHADSWLEFQPAWKSLVQQIEHVDFLIYQAQADEGPIVMDMLYKHGLKKGISLPPQRTPFDRFKAFLSIFNWTIIQQFSEELEYERATAINIIRDTSNNYLLVKRWPYLPGDNDYSFVQGGIVSGESVTDAGVRELKEEVNMPAEGVDLLESPIKANREQIQTSFIRFVGLGAKFTVMKNYLCFGGFHGDKSQLKVNWENKSLIWVEAAKVHKYLAPEKLVIWNRLYSTIKDNENEK